LGDRSRQRILLIGMMGAGKSTVGGLLASRLGWPYSDSDAEVELATGATVPEIFELSGEASFRAEETRVLEAATSSDGPVVVSVAGGAVLSPDNRHLIKSAGFVVWLRAEVKTLAARVGQGAGRPLLNPDPFSALSRLYEERRPLYQQLADLIVDVDGLSPGEIVDRILAARDDACA
jgi:shikimate kinase